MNSMGSPRQSGAARGKTGKSNSVIRPVNPLALWLFRRLIAKRRLRKQFRAVRLAFAHRLPPADTPDKLIFYLNHPSWWDPLLCMFLAERFIPGRSFYAPIDSVQLQRYKVLKPLGLFPVQLENLRGAAQFLRASEAVLNQGDVLGITPQGEFKDVRIRPPGLKPGLSALLARLEGRGPVTVVPIALEYPFWNQRLPEALAAVGTPLFTTDKLPGQTWTELLETQLAAVHDELATLSLARNEAPFETLLKGRTGTSGYYGLWQRLRTGTASAHKSQKGIR